MTIKEWPEKERPREKLLQQGASTLSDAELLAIFLRAGVRGKSAVDIGRDLISEFGNLRSILSADQRQFCRMRGLGPVKFAHLQAAMELGRRYLGEKIHRQDAITNPDAVHDFLTSHLRDRGREIFAVLFLDNRHQVIKYEELFYGTLNSASVHPREIVKQVLHHNAAAVIIAHNHPSGIAEPSQSDADITIKIQKALQLIEVRLLDHIIIGNGEFVSLSDRGII